MRHAVVPCAVCRYEAYELERVQLREGAVKHKTEVETIVLEHQAELDALRTGYESQLSNMRRQVSGLQQRLDDTEGKLADAQVRSAFVLRAFKAALGHMHRHCALQQGVWRRCYAVCLS